MTEDLEEVKPFEQPELKNAPMPPRMVIYRFFVGAVVVLAGAGGVGGLLLGGRFWLLDLFNHFWLHFAVLFGLTTLLLAVLRGRKSLVLSLALLVLSLWLVLPLYLAADQPAGTGAQIELLQFNVNTTAGDPQAVAAYLREQDADIVFLQEVSLGWLNELDGNIGPYELVIAEPRDDNFGIAAYVRADQGEVTIVSSKIVDHTDGLAQVPAIELEVLVERGGQTMTLHILSLHTLPPVNGAYAEARDAQFAAAGAWARDAGPMAVIIGDLNATPWSTPMRRLIDQTDMHNSQLGFGRQPSWPAGATATAGIPIDHCLHGPGLTTTHRSLGEPCGSDHLPLRVRLRGVKP